MGYEEYEPIALKYQVPIVVTGFEPLDILQGIYMTLRQFREGRGGRKSVHPCCPQRGNSHAREILRKVFTVGPSVWQELGKFPAAAWCCGRNIRSLTQKRFGAIAPDGDHQQRLHQRLDSSGSEKAQ